MYSREMENFCFPMFNNQFKMFKKRRYNLVTAEEIGVQNIKRFVLRNKKFIIYKKDNKNQNF